MTIQQLAASQNPETVVNENFDTLGFAAIFGRRHPVTTGLTWGYYGGLWGGLTVVDGELTLTNNATNYVVALRSTGAVSSSTSNTNWNDLPTYARLYQLTVAGGVVTGVEDRRAGFGGAHGQLPPPAVSTVASVASLTLPLNQRVVNVSGSSNITSISAAGQSGAVVTMIFASTPTVTDGGNLRLAGNFVATADDTITLACDGTNWYEVCRSTN